MRVARGILNSTGTRLAILEGALPLPTAFFRVSTVGVQLALGCRPDTRLALGPIDRKATGIKSLCGLGLPVVIGPCRPEYIDAVLALTLTSHSASTVPIHDVHSGPRRGVPALDGGAG